MRGHPSPLPPGGRVRAACAVALATLAVTPVYALARSADPTKSAAACSPVDVAATPERHPTAPARQSASSWGPTTSGTGPARAQPADEELAFVYFRDDRNRTMSGSDEDVVRARRYRRPGEPMLWFRRDGREYVVRDPRVLREVDDLWEPVNRIGAEQGRIGAQQGALGAEQGTHGAQQGEIGARQGEVGARQGVIGARLGVLAAREARGVSASERRAMEQERAALDRDLRQLAREMEALDQELREHDPPTRELGEEVAALGRQMAVLGGRMGAASRRANAGMRTLVDRAITDGAAQAVR